MASAYSHEMFDIESPRVTLMSIGEEKGKGNDLVRETFDRLQEAPLRFVGNVEGRDLVHHLADVVVCDYNYVFAPRNRGLFFEQPGFTAARTLLTVPRRPYSAEFTSRSTFPLSTESRSMVLANCAKLTSSSARLDSRWFSTGEKAGSWSRPLR